MIGSTRNVRVFAWPRPADLRKGFDGLFGLVENGLDCPSELLRVELRGPWWLAAA